MLSRARTALSTLRTMQAGLRFSHGIGPPHGDPAPPSEPGALETYFDSVTEGAGVWKWRHYFPIYERHLAKFIGREPVVIEVGVFSGGSLPMWRDYLGDGSRIYGVDVDERCKAHEQDGVGVFIGDQGDPEFWGRFLAEVPRVDVVIDDGSHEADDQIATLRALLPAMPFGGVYICEDIFGELHQFHSFVDGIARGLGDISTADPSPAKAIHGHVASVHRYPMVTVIEKPAAPVEVFAAPRRGTVWQPGVYPAIG